MKVETKEDKEKVLADEIKELSKGETTDKFIKSLEEYF